MQKYNQLLQKIGMYQFSALSVSKKQLDFFNDNGYLVVKDAISDESIDKLLQRTDQIIEENDIVEKQIFFSADNKQNRSANFLQTGSNISFLLEEGSLDENLKIRFQDKKLALNKIGHAMHDIDEVYERFSYNKGFLNILQGLGIEDPMLVQSIVGSKVDMHADNTYIISEPKLSCIGIWVALADATKENGCMYGFPGSHKQKTNYFMNLNENNNNTVYIGDNPNYDQNYKQSDAKCLEVTKGSVIFLHGDFVHFSGNNTSDQSRPAYTMHLVDVSNGNHWSSRAWLQRVPDLPFRRYIDVVQSLQ